MTDIVHDDRSRNSGGQTQSFRIEMAAMLVILHTYRLSLAF